ncbi:MAG: hypothetical protein GX846_10515 [Deltaproteobacteria bacterium]|nr:hypothetical protein [Deltaproteobacteria bacterium]
MQKALKYSKTIAWIGIALNVILLFLVLTFYYNYLDAPWVDTALNILYPFAFLAGLMMYGGIFTKAVLEYKSGVRVTRRDYRVILLAAAIAVIYYVVKLLL